MISFIDEEDQLQRIKWLNFGCDFKFHAFVIFWIPRLPLHTDSGSTHWISPKLSKNWWIRWGNFPNWLCPAFKRMNKFMNIPNSRFYNHTEQPSMVQNDIRPGRICAVLYDDEWYRAEISAAPISDQVDVSENWNQCFLFLIFHSSGWIQILNRNLSASQVLLVDYAIQRIVRTDVIKYLRDDFVRMPVFALCGCLSGLRPFGAQWTETSLEAFAELIENKILHAEVKEYEQLVGAVCIATEYQHMIESVFPRQLMCLILHCRNISTTCI